MLVICWVVSPWRVAHAGYVLEGHRSMTKRLPVVLAVIAWLGLTALGAWLGYAAVAIIVSAIFGIDVDGALYFLVLAPVGATLGFALGGVFGWKVLAEGQAAGYFRSWVRS